MGSIPIIWSNGGKMTKTKEELESMFLWSEKHKIAYTDGCLLSLDLDRLIRDNIFKYPPSSNTKVFGVFSVNTHKRSLSLENSEVLIYQPDKLIPPEWMPIRDIYMSEFYISSFKEEEFLSKTFLSDMTDFRFSNRYKETRDLYYSRYKKQKQVGDTVMYYYDFGTGYTTTIIMYLEGFEGDNFYGPSIFIKANDYPKYHEEDKLDEIFSYHFYKVGKSETLAVFKELTPRELKELNSLEGRRSCAKCGGRLTLVEGFMSNYRYCQKCE